MTNQDLLDTIRKAKAMTFQVEAGTSPDYTVDVEVHRNVVLRILRGLVDNGHADKPACWEYMAGEADHYLFRP